MVFYRESRIVNQEKEHCKEQQIEMTNLKAELEKEKEELAAVKVDLSKNKLYWARKEEETKQKPADEALFNGIFQQKD